MVYDVEYYFLSSASEVNWSVWVAIAISIIALGTTLWQAHIAREHNKLTVRPYLAGHSMHMGDTYSFIIRNDGLGPAMITGARVYCRGRLIDVEGPLVVDKAFEGVEGCELLEREFFYLEYVLPAGDKIEVCKVRFNSDLGDFDDYLAGILYLEIDYESAYRERCEMYKSRQEGLA